MGLLKFQNNKDYSNANVMSRWDEERAKWLKPLESTKIGGGVGAKTKQPSTDEVSG
jgi:hypothetical protein